MIRIYFNRRAWAIAIFAVAITASYFDSAVNSQEISQLPSAFASKDLARNKNNSARQTLVGVWTSEPYMYKGEKRQNTAFFEPDGTYSLIVSVADGVIWYVADRGTWSLENNTLYQNSQLRGTQSQGAMILSQDKYVYQGSTADASTTWQKIAPKPNLSAQQLVGTWAIESMNVRNNQIVPDLGNFTQMELNLIELNADGTFRIQSSNLTVPDYMKESTASGTWEYVNNGFADGILILKDSQGQVLSVSSVNWSSDNSSVFIINSGKVDVAKSEFENGKVEKLIPTDQKIN